MFWDETLDLQSGMDCIPGWLYWCLWKLDRLGYSERPHVFRKVCIFMIHPIYSTSFCSKLESQDRDRNCDWGTSHCCLQCVQCRACPRVNTCRTTQLWNIVIVLSLKIRADHWRIQQRSVNHGWCIEVGILLIIVSCYHILTGDTTGRSSRQGTMIKTSTEETVLKGRRHIRTKFIVKLIFFLRFGSGGGWWYKRCYSADLTGKRGSKRGNLWMNKQVMVFLILKIWTAINRAKCFIMSWYMYI